VIVLQGITWDHPRGLAGVRATAAVFEATRPDVRVEWTTRSLQAFADEPIELLADRFDLIVVDHPAIGEAVSRGCLEALDDQVERSFIQEQEAGSVGRSAQSYRWDGRVWAFAIDAAAQVAAYRPDLLERCGSELPRTWDDVEVLGERARSVGSRIAFPAIPVDAVLAFLAICCAVGEEPCAGPDRVVDPKVGERALTLLGRVVSASHPESTSWNPPRMLERMSTTDEVVYAPLAFGYSNYARPGFRPNLVRVGPGPCGPDGVARGTLGGAGLAVSSRRPNVEAAASYACFTADPLTQRTTYALAGGQPGHRSAWTDPSLNASSSGFYADTLGALDAAYLRPRYDGVLGFQEAGGDLIHAWLREGGDTGATLDVLDERYRASLPDDMARRSDA
jgi:multiple sugar transport system substrate-binding protein